MAISDEQMRLNAMDLALRVPDRQQYAGMSTLQHGYSGGRDAGAIIADAQKILAFLKPPAAAKKKKR